MSKKILIVEDEKKLNKMISDYLIALDYSTINAYDGLKALTLIKQEKPDLVVLDIMLPGIDGLELTRIIRKQSYLPIIMLTARSAEADKLIGLELGADDYIVKPFSMKELVARIRAVLRRTTGLMKPGSGRLNNTKLIYADLELDVEKMIVTQAGKRLSFTPVQFEILKTMLNQPGKVFTRKELLNAFQDTTFTGYERNIDVHIKNIRKQLSRYLAQKNYIQTIYGVGYKLKEEDELS